MKRLPPIKSPPPWFHLESYEICDHFTPSQWADELEERKRRRGLVEFYKGYNDADLPDVLLSRIIAPPSARLKTARTVSTSPEAIDPSPPSPVLNLNSCVRPLMFTDIAKDRHFHDFGELERSAERKRYDEVIEVEENEVYAVVDLTASDSAIENAILDFVKKIRQIKGIPLPTKGGTKASIAKIRQYKVLPYLDLLNWAELKAFSVPASVVADTLFPTDPTKDEKFVRETLSEWAESALRPGFIANLRELTED